MTKKGKNRDERLKVNFSQITISSKYSNYDGIEESVCSWENRPPFTIPINIVRFPEEVLVSMDNRRLYSAIAHSPATFEITAQAKFHNFSDELPESMRLPLLQRCFIWEVPGGCYRLKLAPLAWGTAILFRTVTQSPDFPLEGREDSPVIGPIRYPYFVLTPSFVKYQHVGGEEDHWKSLFSQASQAGLVHTSFNNTIWICRPSLTAYLDQIFQMTEMISFNFLPTVCLRARGQNADDHWDEEDRERFASLSDSLHDFDNQWELCELIDSLAVS
jgi:hypothetical protein